MSGLRKRDPSGNRPVRPAPRERQNPQRWRQAFGDLRPQTGSLFQPKSDIRETQFTQRWGTQDANVAGQGHLYEGLPEPTGSMASSTNVIAPPKMGDRDTGLAPAIPPIPKKKMTFTSSESSSSLDGPPTTIQGDQMARNPIWRATSSLSQFSRKMEDSSMRSATPPPATGTDRELEELVAKPAFTADERYRILDCRDKIIRKRNPKVKVRVEFAVTLAGTCRDMCPEKERYMREVQRRLSSYECDSSEQDPVVDHQLAIKEYSRSSADQEEPLSHDLRPVQSLHLTFDYLLHNIISRMEDENESLSDLYYFIWDRTRALRKDMTQQQLGTTEAVLLMEKCARFHIYCSTRLCELDRHSFDPKLNDENLMKCLQSLEHMYADLVPHGIECPNEPEFRAYQILMHLNEGDIVGEIQQKPDRILKSAPVAHALRIYAALNSMNAIAFFRLVEKSSFMVSCILHRYFFQIRTNALRRFLKTFVLKSYISMPTMQVKRILGFGAGDENMNTFKYFCESHGFSSPNIGPVSMTMRSRNEFEQPEFNLINREPSLIESKLKFSVSEAINGVPLGQNPLESYVPHSSFDENGFFKRELLEGLKLNVKPLTSGTSPQLQTASPQSTAPGLPLRAATISGDIRNRLGTRVGPSPAGSELPIRIKPIGAEVTTAQPGASFTFSTALASPRPIFGSASNAAANFSFTAPVTAAPIAGGPPRFSFATSTLRPTGLPVAANFGSSSVQANAEREKAKAEEKRKIGAEFGLGLAQKLVTEIVAKEVREVATLVRQENVVRDAKEVVQKSLSLQIYKEIETAAVQKLAKSTVEEEVMKARNVAASCLKIENELRGKVVDNMIGELAQKVLKQHKAEQVARLKKLDEICRRIKLRDWFITWRETTTEQKEERLRELQRQQWNVENFPPILTCQFSTAAILSDWSGIMPLVEKPMQENAAFELVERAMEVERSFEKHLEEFSPSIIHHVAAPLLSLLNSAPAPPPVLTEWHPPVAFNVVLLSNEFGPWEYLGNWTWSSLAQDSIALGDSNYCSHLLPNERNMFLTFQKCTNPDEISIDTRAVLCFNSSNSQQPIQKRPSILDGLRKFIVKNPQTPIAVFNATTQTEKEILFHLGVEPKSPESDYPYKESDSTVSDNYVEVIEIRRGNKLAENIPALVHGLHWIAQSLKVGPPLEPPVILLPFAHFAGTVLRDIFPRRFKGVTCPSQLYDGHRDLIHDVAAVIQNPDTLATLKRWPGRASKLLVQKYSKSLCFSRDAGVLSVVIKNLSQLENALKIEPPVDLMSKYHQGVRLSPAEVNSALKIEIAKITNCYPLSDNLRTRFNFVLSSTRKEGFIPWKEFLTVCQEMVLERLSTLTSAAYEVCVDLQDVQALSSAVSLSRCSGCCDLGGRKRRFSMENDISFLLQSPKYKTICKESDTQNLLQNMQSLLQEVKLEKEELQSSFNEYYSPV